MSKAISFILTIGMVLSTLVFPVKADNDTPYFTHQNIVGSQTCYSNDTDEKVITEIPNVYQGIRINQPVFRVYMGSENKNKAYKVEQLLKDNTVIHTDNVTSDNNGVIKVSHRRNCEMIKVYDGGSVVASLGKEREYTNGVFIDKAPMSYQIYQRDNNNNAPITIHGYVSDASAVSVTVGQETENVQISNDEFTYTKNLSAGLYDIEVKSDKGTVATYTQVGVGDVWVCAGQSNMTDMGAITDGFVPNTDDPINENMHIIHAEDCAWRQMTHPAGEGRFFKSGVRTSPVTTFAREISAYTGVPVGIVQTSVGGTNIWQWVKGVRDSEESSGYLFDALTSCFDKMDKNIKGVLWYQGCNDAISENYAYNYKNLQQKVFDNVRAFFGEDTPIITTQINDANQDSTASLGYYDAWSYVKDIQRQNEDLYDNVYVVSTGEQELGDTIHNNTASNVILGGKWARAAENAVYGDKSVSYHQPTVDTITVTGDREVTVTFKNTNGLKLATGIKRLGITNVSGGGYKIELGDLKKEFTIHKGATRTVTGSNKDRGEEVTITNAVISDNNKIVLTTAEDLAGVVAVDCMYGKRFTPTLVDATTNESVFAFFNVIAKYENQIETDPEIELSAIDTADLNNMTQSSSDTQMYVNYYKSGSTNYTSYGFMKFDLSDIDLSKIAYAKLAGYGNSIGKDRTGNITISDVGTDWDNSAVFNNPEYKELAQIKKINSNTAGVFPVGQYSDIDITEYLRTYKNNEIGIGIASDYASDVNLSGVNTDNPPKLIIMPGNAVTLKYLSDNAACADIKVNIEAVGATEYTKTEFTTDKNGEITLYLPKGSYKATTVKDSSYLESSNTFTVTDDINNTYALDKNSEVTPTPTVKPDNTTYTFGDSYNEIKPFDRNALSTTAIGNSGVSVETSTSNYNNVVVRDKNSTNSGYYPYGNGLADNGYYLFIGSGGNSNVTAKLYFDTPIEAGSTVTFTYAKPKATNNGTTLRSAGNTNEISIDNQKIDIQAETDYDTWVTKSVTVTNDISELTVTLGKWSAIAIKEIKVSKEASVTPTPVPTATPTVTPIPENSEFTFSGYSEIKPFTVGNLAETNIGDTGLKISASSTNYNNVVIRDKNSTNSGYYPYGNGLSDNGTYLFIGCGGNGGDSVTLTLPQTVKKDKFITVTYAKPKATNNGSAFRNQANNNNVITIGNQKIDVKDVCEFDTWYTTTVVADSDISSFKIDLGSWSAIAISKIKISDSEDVMEFIAPSKSQYITTKNETVEFGAKVYSYVTKELNGTDIIAKGDENTTADVAYSVNNYDGVSITKNGVLTILPTAKEGTVTVTADYAGYKKSVDIELVKLGSADTVKITGDEVIKRGKTANFRAIPLANNTVILERPTTWEIVGDNHGCSITDGVLTVPQNATTGNITIRAELDVYDVQTQSGVFDTFTVTIADDTVSPYEVKGIFLKNCIEKVETANGIDGVIINTSTKTDGYSVVVKAEDENGLIIKSETVALDTDNGISEVKVPMTFEKATQIRSYVINSDNEVVSDIFKTDKTAYKNVPLVSDWLTGKNSGLGMGAGVLSPKGVPYGVNPGTVDVSTLNVNYTYDNNYKGAEFDNVLWYKTGAFLAKSGSSSNSIYDMHQADWEQQALPIGNGYMGGMVFGMPDKDQIQINEETFWAAGYRGYQSSVNKDTVNKDMSEAINGYMSVGNVFIDFNMPIGATVKNYYRDLNLDDAVAHVRYEYDNKSYNREYFASYPREVIALRYTGDNLNFSVNPVSMHPGTVTVNNGEIKIVGKLKDSEPYSSGGNTAWSQESDLEYCTIIKVIPDNGEMADGYNCVDIKNSTGVTILISAATDYDKDRFVLNADGTVDMTKTPYKSEKGVQTAIEKAENRINGASKLTYDELKNEHIADYKSQFDTVKFSLTDNDEVCNIPTNELQASYSKVVGVSDHVVTYDKDKYNALNKHLEELHYNYARYMMISSSRSDTMPATLQGKWCQSVAEIWGSCYCININMEMNYWFAGGANLADSAKSLIGWFKSQIPAGRVTARNYYNVVPKSYTYKDGEIVFTNSNEDKDDVFIMHTKQSIMGTTDLTGSTSIQSPGNTAWLMYNLWDLYKTTGDKELLRNEIYPIMRKCANFYTQYLYLNEKKTTTDLENYPDGYYYTTWTGRSPEQGPYEEGVKYDLELVAGMYDYTIEAANVLGIDTDKVGAWNEIRNHLETPVEIGVDGVIKEWKSQTTYNNYEGGSGDVNHRHISHLVGLYPGNLINRDTPMYLDAAKKVLELRGDDSTGWSCSNKFLLWARVLDGDKALELFRYQLGNRTYANLFDTHAPFQIDGNFGSAAGVMELLMQSQTGKVYILPALPTVWDKGEISGIKAKNGAEVSIKWSDNKADEFSIIPVTDGDVVIGYEKDNKTFKLNGKTVTFDNDEYVIKNAKAGVQYKFTVSDDVEITISDTTVSTNANEGVLIIAGYDNNGNMLKSRIVDGYQTDISDFDNAKTIKAFLWNNLSDMIPLCAPKTR
ncbi:MAG: glycoside hydrolase N-terminal domain-containing protein [Clostridia bacterium]|nr:glycoside hydrolase N-terminal domain-containing protein [Clostridia bacterium]